MLMVLVGLKEPECNGLNTKTAGLTRHTPLWRQLKLILIALADTIMHWDSQKYNLYMDIHTYSN